MAYRVDCDSCEFARDVADEVTAYAVARDHEAEHADHYVQMERPG